VELQHKARFNDRLVLLAHRLAESSEKRLVRGVVPVLPAGKAPRRDRGDKPLLRFDLGEGGFEVRKIGIERLLANIRNRTGKDRRPAAERARRAKARRVELAIELGKFQPIPPPGKRRQASRLAGFPAAKAPPGIARPGAVI